jgi:hypothetical protein
MFQSQGLAERESGPLPKPNDTFIVIAMLGALLLLALALTGGVLQGGRPALSADESVFLWGP